MTSRIMPLADAIRRLVKDGQSVALEGFAHLVPYAAGHEIVRQKRRGLTLVRMTPDILCDQLIGMGCAAKLDFAWAGNPGVGSLHRFRDAVENGWPHRVEIEEYSHADMAGRYQAGASGLPFSVLRGYLGSDLPRHNPNIRTVVCPFTHESLAATPAINPDVTIVHAQRADRKGNVLVQGVIGVQKEAVLAARSAIATVEEVVDDLQAPMNSCVLPHWVLDAVCEVPFGAHPSYAHGYYDRDNAFCRDWDAISRDRERFLEWMNAHVVGTRDHAQFLTYAGIR